MRIFNRIQSIIDRNESILNQWLALIQSIREVSITLIESTKYRLNWLAPIYIDSEFFNYGSAGGVYLLLHKNQFKIFFQPRQPRSQGAFFCSWASTLFLPPLVCVAFLQQHDFEVNLKRLALLSQGCFPVNRPRALAAQNFFIMLFSGIKSQAADQDLP